VVDYLPSPVDIFSIEGTDPDDEEKKLRRQVGDDEPVAALAFKIMTDPYVGKLVYFRVYSGTFKRGVTVYNPRTRNKERIGRLLQMHANQREERDEIYSGDIAAGVGLRNLVTGDNPADPPAGLFPYPVCVMRLPLFLDIIAVNLGGCLAGQSINVGGLSDALVEQQL
jgi:elongation factor G